MTKTRDKLQDEGVSTEIIEYPFELDQNTDIVHIYNIPFSERCVEFSSTANEIGAKIVCTPIYWDFSHSMIAKVIGDYFHRTPPELAEQMSPVLFKNLYWLIGALFNSSDFDLNRKRMRTVVESADYILPNSRAEFRKLCEWTHNEPARLESRVSVVPNAVDTSLFYPGPDNKKETEADSILAVGRISPNKNQLSVVRAAKRLGIDVKIIGTGSGGYSKKVINLTNDYANGTYIEEVPHSELRNHYASSSAHVLPSFRDSPGLVSLEAAICGTEIVVSNKNFCPREEYFSNNAHVCNPYSNRSITQAIKQSLSTEKNTQNFRSELSSKYNWRSVAKDTLAVYEKLR